MSILPYVYTVAMRECFFAAVDSGEKLLTPTNARIASLQCLSRGRCSSTTNATAGTCRHAALGAA
jgi:hypothetical protein